MAEPETGEPSTPPPEPPPELLDEQPWLRAEVSPPEEQSAALPAVPKRLVANVQGLLDPVRVFSEPTDEEHLPALPPFGPPPLDLNAEQVRRLRTILTEEPLLADAITAPVAPLPALRTRWIALLVTAVVCLPFLLGEPPTANGVQAWPGVAAAYETIQALPPGASVLLLWAYEPATAGEMDLLALSLVAHLAERESQPVVISLLPTGLATARRLFAQATAPEVQDSAVQLAVGQEQFVTGGFLSGGAAALALVGQDLPTGLNQGVTVGAAAAPDPERPVLAILLAAQAEEVQQWLEQTQPLNELPVVAFTSASADLILRPYWESGQLAGLVGGFDGAAAYQQLRAGSPSPLVAERFARQLSAQNWGQAAFVLLIVLGNLALLLGRAREGEHDR
jgi:hypothetical protein